MRIFALPLFLLLSSQSAWAQLDRLFFSENDRRTLDHARERASRTVVADYASPSVDGIVRRSDGKNTVWINGHPFQASDAISGRAQSLPINVEERLRISVTASDRSAQPEVTKHGRAIRR
jgi:hypothetical protein